MGLIEIRSRSERLGNLGATRRTETAGGAAAARASMANDALDAGRAASRIGDGLGDLAKLGFTLAKDWRDKADSELADRYVSRFQEGMDAYNDGTTDAQGNRVPGAMEQTPEDTGKWIDGNVEYRDKFGARLKEELKMTPRAMEMARKRLVGYNLHTQGRWQGRAAKVDDLKAQSAASERQQAAHSTLARIMVDGDTNEHGADYALALEEWKDAVENRLDKARLPEEARSAERRKAALQLCQDVLAARLRRCGEDAQASETATPESVKGAYEDLEETLKDPESGWEGLFPFGATALNENDDVISDPVRESLKGADLEAFKAAALKDLEAARGRDLRERDARERERNAAVGRAFTEKELALRDVPQEKWADAYDEMGKDEKLKKADPARAMRYRDAAREMRTAERAAKESERRHAEMAASAARDASVKHNEDMLDRAIAMLNLMKMEGSLSQDEENEAQAAIWRKFCTLSRGGGVHPQYMTTFMRRWSEKLSDQEANAMRKFYLAFGYSADLDKGGEPTATARKDAEKDTTGYYAPGRSAPRQFGFFEKLFADPITRADMLAQEKPETISASELLAYGDRLLRTLRAQKGDMNREGLVESEITRLKTDWIRKDRNKNLKATVRSVMDMQRETRTRWEMAQPDKRSEEYGGRREDGKTAK